MGGSKMGGSKKSNTSNLRDLEGEIFKGIFKLTQI